MLIQGDGGSHSWAQGISLIGYGATD